jgi:hypothetical protein
MRFPPTLPDLRRPDSATDRRTLVASLIPLLLLSATGTTSRCSLSTEAGAFELRISGTVRFLETDGGCWQLETADGRHYELLPDQAPPSLLQHGARATVTGQTAESGTGCQVGLPLAVRRVITLEAGPDSSSADRL